MAPLCCPCLSVTPETNHSRIMFEGDSSSTWVFIAHFVARYLLESCQDASVLTGMIVDIADEPDSDLYVMKISQYNIVTI